MAESHKFTAASSQYLEYASAVSGPHIDITAYPFSMCGWFRSSGAAAAGVAMSDSSVSNVNLAIGPAILTVNEMGIFARNGASNEFTVSVDSNTWYHVAGVFNSATDRELFINGVSQGTDTGSVTFPSGLDVSGVGRLGDSTPSAYFNGEMAYVRIFNSALSSTDINNLMLNPDSVTSNRVWALDLTNASTPGEDTSGNGYDATGTAPTSSNQTPPYIKSGASYLFDRTNNNFLFRDDATGPHGQVTDEVTLAAWIKSTGTQSGTLIGIVSFGNGLFVAGVNSSGNARYYINGLDLNGSISLTDGSWHFVTYTTNSSKNSHEVRIDGVSDATSSSTATYPTLSTTYIGNRGDGGLQPWNGYISYVHIYNRKLTDSELEEIRYKPGSITNNLVGYYPLLSGDYFENNDLSGNGFDMIKGRPETPSVDGPSVQFY